MSSEEFRDTAGLCAEEIEPLAYSLAEEGAEAPPQTIAPRIQRDDAPLSYAQERLWFLDQWQPNDSSYNIPAALTLRTLFDARTSADQAIAVAERRIEQEDPAALDLLIDEIEQLSSAVVKALLRESE